MDGKIFLISLIVCILCNIVRFTYEILKHTKIIKANQITLMIIFPIMVLLWISWVLLCIYDPHHIEIAGIIRYAAISLSGAGVIIFLMALLTIKTFESYEGDLITRGIFSKIRHPMYLGFILWLAGLPVYFEALYAFILAFVFIANVFFWRYLEEKELLARFPSYKDYKKQTLF